MPSNSSNSGFHVSETGSTLKIEFLRTPDFPLGTFLLEILVLNLVIIVSAFLLRRLFGPAAVLFILAGVLSFPFYLVWNYRAKDSLELTENTLKLERHIPPFVLRQQRYQKNEVGKLRIIQPQEKLAAFEGIFGLRLLFIQNRGNIGFETPQGMLIRFGWGVDAVEGQKVIAVIQQWAEKPKPQGRKHL